MTKADPAENSLRVLNQFVLRGRRIQAHSLLRDQREMLRRTASAELTVIHGEDGTEVVWIHLPEEQVESAAARVRPLILESEATYYVKVFNALGYLLRDHPDEALPLKGAKNAWRQRLEASPSAGKGGYEVTTGGPGVEAATLNNLDLAQAWIYGDVVHADSERRDRSRRHGVQTRFRAGQELVAWLLLHSDALTTGVIRLHEVGLIELDPSVLTEEVVAQDGEIRQKVKVVVGDLGATAPIGLDEVDSSQWRPLFDDTIHSEPE